MYVYFIMYFIPYLYIAKGFDYLYSIVYDKIIVYDKGVLRNTVGVYCSKTQGGAGRERGDTHRTRTGAEQHHTPAQTPTPDCRNCEGVSSTRHRQKSGPA